MSHASTSPARRGKLDDLLGQLAAHRLDALLADEPPPSGTQVKTFTHPLGASGVTFCASPTLAKKLRLSAKLAGRADAFSHAEHRPAARSEKWFRAAQIEPVVVGEFEDAALAKIVATDGIGITVVPTVVMAEAIGASYGFVSLGRTDGPSNST